MPIDPTAPRTAFDARLARLADHPLVGAVAADAAGGTVTLVADRADGRRFDPVHAVGARLVRFAAANRVNLTAVGDVVAIPFVAGEDADALDDRFDRVERSLDDTEAWSWADGRRGAGAATTR